MKRIEICKESRKGSFLIAIKSHKLITGKQRQRHGVEFDCNQGASLVRCVRPIIDFN